MAREETLQDVQNAIAQVAMEHAEGAIHQQIVLLLPYHPALLQLLPQQQMLCHNDGPLQQLCLRRNLVRCLPHCNHSACLLQHRCATPIRIGNTGM